MSKDNCEIKSVIQEFINGKIYTYKTEAEKKFFNVFAGGIRVWKMFNANDAKSTTLRSKSPAIRKVSSEFQGDYIEKAVDENGDTIEQVNTAHQRKMEWNGESNLWDIELGDIVRENKKKNGINEEEFVRNVGKKETEINTKIKNDVSENYENYFNDYFKENYEKLIDDKINNMNDKNIQITVVKDILNNPKDVNYKFIKEQFDTIKSDYPKLKDETIYYKIFQSEKKDIDFEPQIKINKNKIKNEIIDKIKKKKIDKINKELYNYSFKKSKEKLKKNLYKDMNEFELKYHLKKQDIEQTLIKKALKTDVDIKNLNMSNNIHLSFMDISKIEDPKNYFKDIIITPKEYIIDNDGNFRIENDVEYNNKVNKITLDLISELSKTSKRDIEKFSKYIDYNRVIEKGLSEQDHKIMFRNFEKKIINNFTMKETLGFYTRHAFDNLSNGLRKQMIAEGIKTENIDNDLGALEKLYKQHMDTSGIPDSEVPLLGMSKQLLFANAVPMITINSIAEYAPLAVKNHIGNVIKSLGETINIKKLNPKELNDLQEFLTYAGEFIPYYHQDSFKSSSYRGEEGEIIQNGSLINKIYNGVKYIANKSNNVFGLRGITFNQKALNTASAFKKLINDISTNNVEDWVSLGLRRDTIKYMKENNIKKLSDFKDDTFRNNLLQAMTVNNDIIINTNANYTTAYKVFGKKVDRIKENPYSSPFLFFLGWLERVHNTIMAKGLNNGKNAEMLGITISTAMLVTGINYMKLQMKVLGNPDREKEIEDYKKNIFLHLLMNMGSSATLGLFAAGGSRGLSMLGYNFITDKSYRGSGVLNTIAGPVYGEFAKPIKGVFKLSGDLVKGKTDNIANDAAKGTFNFLMPSIPYFKEMSKYQLDKNDIINFYKRR